MIQMVVGAVIGFFVGAVATVMTQILIEDWQNRRRK